MSKALQIMLDGTMHETTADYEAIRTGIGGGWIQAIQLPDGNYMYMDEDGKLKGLQYNFFATVLARPILFSDDYVAGPVVICGPDNGDGDHLDVHEEATIRARVEDMKSRML